MNQLQNTNRIVFLEDLAQQLNTDIVKQHKQIIQTSVLYEARTLATKNLPAPEENKIEPFITSIMGQYTALKKDIATRLNGTLQGFLSQVSIPALNDAIEQKKIKGEAEAHKLNSLEGDKCKISLTQKPNSFKKYKPLLLLFALAECLWSISCFLKLGDIVIIAVFIGIIIGLAQVYAAKISVLFIRELPSDRQRKLYYKVALIAFSLFSLFLGGLRYYFAHQGNASHIPFIVLNPFFFAAVNMVLIIASALLVHFFHPLKSEMEQLKRIEEIESDILKTKKLKDQYDSELSKIIEERGQLFKVHGAIAHTQKELQEKVDALFDEAVGVFKHENVTKRTDNAFPLCFKSKHDCLPNTTEKEPFSFLTLKPII